MRQKTLVDTLLYLLGMLFNLVLMVAIGYAIFRFTVWGFNYGTEFSEYMVGSGEDREVIFVLDDYTPLAEVARRLEEEGLIPSALMFRLERTLMNRTHDFRPGTFTLNSNMSSSQLNNTLRAGPPREQQFQWITIPEGWTIAEMAAYFESREFFTAEEFIHAAQYSTFNYHFLNNVPLDRPNRLEGYLFPDSYQISMTPSPEHIIHRMLMRFEQLFTAYYQDLAHEMGLTIDQVVIMASIIERETRIADERPLVSQVIHNRLRLNMRLQMDSTTAYAVGVTGDMLTQAHLDSDLPHNTYVHFGLPPGSISNPGWASIRAVMVYPAGDYIFFVLRNSTTGEHFFSTNYADHNAAVQRYRPLW